MDAKSMPNGDKAANMIDMTIFGTPLPRASSTVARTAGSRNMEDIRQSSSTTRSRYSMLSETDSKRQSADSSLGILGNISSLLGNSACLEDADGQNMSKKIDVERELARKLLRRCSEAREQSFTSDRDKENDGNIHNISYTHSLISADPDTLERSNQLNGTRTISERTPKDLDSSSVIFKANEISARSSTLGVSFDKRASSGSVPSQQGGISFDTSAAAELMAQFGDEDFKSGSKIGSQLLADELSWQQNYSYALPGNVTANSGKEHLELSCFSGVIGELDLSLQSDNGRKVSIGEFFKRKCGQFGQLQESDSLERPSFGVSIKSPRKHRKNIPLVDDTLASEAASIQESSETLATSQVKQHSLMSLSSIAQALNDIENGSPRRLVDELILAKKRGKPKLPVESQPLQQNPLVIREKPERDVTLNRLGVPGTPKFSLDSRVIETPKNKSRAGRMSLNVERDARPENMNRSFSESFAQELNSRERTSFTGSNTLEASNQTKISKDSAVDCSIGTPNGSMSKNSTLTRPVATRKSVATASPRREHPDFDRTKVLKRSPASPYPERDSATAHFRSVKREEHSTRSLFKHPNEEGEDANPFQRHESVLSEPEMDLSQPKSKSQDRIISTKSADKLFSCIVGVPREAEIEITNGSDRWMTCVMSLQHVQGDETNLLLELPESKILVGPNGGKSVKVHVTVLRMDKPIIAVIKLAISDMVTRSKNTSQHLMCFVPEEAQIEVTTPFGSDTMDFQSVAETRTETIPLTLENKNYAELPIQLKILQKPQLFSVNEASEFLVLGPHERATVDVRFKAPPLRELSPGSGCFRAAAKLIVQLRSGDSKGHTLKGVVLSGCVCAAKVDLVDTPLPVIVGRNESKPFNLMNVGAVPVGVTATLVENKYVNGHVEDFWLDPAELFLQPGERGTVLVSRRPDDTDGAARQIFVKVTVGENDSYYPVARENNHLGPHYGGSRNGQRCVTPTSRKINSPSSPVSTTSTCSGNSGRHSLGSAASTSTVSGDAIPIQSTHKVVTWHSIKTGKRDTKDVTIRNKSDHKIKLQVNIVDNNRSFKFLKDRHTVGTSMLLVLQSRGSKTLSVVFEPTNVGACSGQMQFKHYSDKQEPASAAKMIFLYGYGGVGRVDISQVFKDTSGRRWLSLGRMNSGDTLSTKFKLQNTGDLRAFARIKLKPEVAHSAIKDNWSIEPAEMLLGPGEVQWVRLEFNPKYKDLARLQRADILEVGTVTVFHGDEPTRLRIRRVHKKLKDAGQLKNVEDDDFRNVVFPLCKAFPGEVLIDDLKIISDKIQYLGDLCDGISQTHITLTVEINGDDSMAMLDDNINDTQMFYSVCSDTGSMSVAGCEVYMPSETTIDRHHGDGYEYDFTVTPSSVVLAPPYRTDATVTVSSRCNVAQPFETILSGAEGLIVVPTEGMIPAGRNFPLKVQCSEAIDHNIEAVLQIFMENDKREVLIKVLCNH